MTGDERTSVSPAPDGDGRFTLGLLLDVAEVLEKHGYGALDGRGHVELQMHLFHLLCGTRHGSDRCVGKALPDVPAAAPTGEHHVARAVADDAAPEPVVDELLAGEG